MRSLAFCWILNTCRDTPYLLINLGLDSLHMGRSDFSGRTREHLERSTGYRCAKPDCQVATSGPTLDMTRTISVADAAHKYSATGSPGSPRPDESMSAEQRKAVENGIWLCPRCARLIDRDPKGYSVEELHGWQHQATLFAMRELHNPLVRSSATPDQISAALDRFLPRVRSVLDFRVPKFYGLVQVGISQLNDMSVLIQECSGNGWSPAHPLHAKAEQVVRIQGHLLMLLKRLYDLVVNDQSGCWQVRGQTCDFASQWRTPESEHAFQSFVQCYSELLDAANALEPIRKGTSYY